MAFQAIVIKTCPPTIGYSSILMSLKKKKKERKIMVPGKFCWLVKFNFSKLCFLIPELFLSQSKMLLSWHKHEEICTDLIPSHSI